jgi:hypothetical protein
MNDTIDLIMEKAVDTAIDTHINTNTKTDNKNIKLYNGIAEYPMNILAQYCSEDWREQKQYSWCFSDNKRRWRNPRKVFDLSTYTVRHITTLLYPGSDNPTLLDACIYEKKHGWFGKHFQKKKDYLLEVQVENDTFGKSSLVFTNMRPDKKLFSRDELSYGKGTWYKPSLDK